MANLMNDTPVLIVGGGPAGLAMAIELGWRNVPCILLEEGDGSVDHPRLGTILLRTMEFARRWGIVDRIHDCGFQKDYDLNVVYCTSLAGHLLGMDEFPSCQDMPNPPESPERRQRCPQFWFNPILERTAKEYPSVDIRHFHRVESFSQNNECVEARVIGPDGNAITITADFMIAADGATSVVRRQTGVEMIGNPKLSLSVNLFIRSPQLLKMHNKGPAERYIFVGPEGTWGNLTVVDGRELWRITFIGGSDAIDIKSLDVDAIVKRAFGRDDIPYELISVKPWRRTELTAKNFQFGRVFLAGDAAHTMSPTGGHGMSTGLADAVNLGWKLEAIVKGWAPPSLLDSYEPERRPVAVQAAAASADNFRAWISVGNCGDILDPGQAGEATRASVGAHMLEHGRQDWDSIGLQLGYRYDDSPICVNDDTPVPPFVASEYPQTTRPGARAPHVWMKDGRSTLDLFGHGFTLMRLGADAPTVHRLLDAARKHDVPISVVESTEPDVVAAYERKLVLVRPDGHVAWRADTAPLDSDALIDKIRGVAAG